jgi:hypothetical protein
VGILPYVDTGAARGEWDQILTQPVDVLLDRETNQVPIAIAIRALSLLSKRAPLAEPAPGISAPFVATAGL